MKWQQTGEGGGAKTFLNGSVIIRLLSDGPSSHTPSLTVAYLLAGPEENCPLCDDQSDNNWSQVILTVANWCIDCKVASLFCRVGIQLPTVEVRFKHITVQAKCYVGTRALPTLVNTIRNFIESALGSLGIGLTKMTNLTILKDASGIIKPSRSVGAVEFSLNTSSR